MTVEATLEALDLACARAGLHLVAVPGARLALFGPHRAGPGFTLVLAPIDDGRTLAVRVRPAVAHAAEARLLLQDVIDEWQPRHEWLRLRVARMDVEGEVSLLVDGDVHVTDVGDMTSDALARRLQDVAAASRDFWDTCPVVLPSLTEVADDLVRDLETMLIESDG